jgi:geranylgeranylglycerol-phosphate geranylgeranyltransferase
MKALQFLRVSRVWNGAIVSASVALGALFAESFQTAPVVLACISGFLIASGGYAINDYFDHAIDSINKPTRPIPSGKVTRRETLMLAFGSAIGGVIVAWFINNTSFLLALAAAVLLFIYSHSLKRTLLAGNVSISLLCGTALLYGGASVSNLHSALIPAGFAFLFNLGREILKDVEDVKGDAEEGAQTMPILWSGRGSIFLATSLWLVLIVLTFLPYAAGRYGLPYLLTVVVVVDLPLLAIIGYSWTSRANYGRANTLLKLLMVLGLLSLYMAT